MNTESLSKVFATHLGKTLHSTEEEIAVMAYGLFALLQTLLSIGIVIAIGAFLGIMFESFILSLSIALLRKYSGGAHATSAERCLFIGTFISILGALLGHKLGLYLTVPLTVYIIFFIFIWNFYIVFKLAPVASPSKPLSSISKQQKLKRGSLTMLLIYLLTVIFLSYITLVSHSPFPLIYAFCIMIGMSWQVFTLTTIGHKVASFLDHALIHIFSIIKISNYKGENNL
ncbi:accessory gene regulator B family protein [Niameybacter massiliensis]|uniref:Accessory gene regulator B family protein n=1 Tax=Holtiella tumoricola TaxID=3018743 RepID=A0AA42DKZ2_9FIRM|nr:accessory gene regulator B family protein [Holtiella tumoricola]MDA3730824.1 accessory gene regulator B family protein [Holtiella tumoricola]